MVNRSDTSDGGDRGRFAGSLGAASTVHNGYQYVVYYGPKDKTFRGTPYGDVFVARRNMDGFSDWEHARVKGYRVTSENTHNRQAIIVSEGDGVIHIAFDHHSSRQLHYAHSVRGAADNPVRTEWNDNTFTYVPNLDFPPLRGQRAT